MDLAWIALQEFGVYVLFWPLLTVGLLTVSAAILLAIAELLMYATYRVLTRMGVLD